MGQTKSLCCWKEWSDLQRAKGKILSFGMEGSWKRMECIAFQQCMGT